MKRCLMKELLLLALALTMSLPAMTQSQSGGDSGSDKITQRKQANALKWKERILKVPTGSYVNVKLENKAEFEGQLREITDSAFSLQILEDSRIKTVEIHYEDMKSLSVSGRPSAGGKVAKSILFSAL